MRSQTEDQPSDEEDIEYVSKSQLKRDSKALQDLGKKLSTYNDEQLARIPLDHDLLDAIHLAHKLVHKRGALKRHFQFIGKLLRNTDAEPIIAAVTAIEEQDRINNQRFHRLEQWRDEILEHGDAAIQQLCAQHPELDRQHLRQLWRNHQRAPADKRPQVARQLFKELRDSVQE